jgi:hypothetical protein
MVIKWNWLIIYYEYTSKYLQVNRHSRGQVKYFLSLNQYVKIVFSMK